MSLSEKNCNFKECDSKTKKALCEYKIEIRTFLSLQDIINKEKIIK